MCGIDAYAALSGLDISWMLKFYMDCAPLGLNDEAKKAGYDFGLVTDGGQDDNGKR